MHAKSLGLIRNVVRTSLTSALLVLASVNAESATPVTVTVEAQAKPISPDLFGVFFEDINYAADGGLYAELVQNRSFEYQATEQLTWNPLTFWELTTRGGGKGSVTIAAADPIHLNNPHYAVLDVVQPGEGVGLVNSGFDGIPVQAGEYYRVSLFAQQLYVGERWNGRSQEGKPAPLIVRLESKTGRMLGEAKLDPPGWEWTNLTARITASGTETDARLVVLGTGRGGIALDVISVFPERTYRGRSNGLRADLARAIADLHPRFIRFPGGCLAHGNGLGNMYRWKDTIGPIEQRREQANIWGYHQTVGLGYFEYFQFCEDIGAQPLPVVPAGVCCQNSGQTGGTGQKGLPMDQMPAYLQEVLDLIEWANGPTNSTWGAKRVAAGHPEPFHLKYVGVGNEDHITPVFKERFKPIYDALKTKHPEIVVIGTVGPFHSGADFDEGWKFANEHRFDMVDEHYYEKPAWFLNNLKRYDNYDRAKSKVYLGEYAAHDEGRANTLRSALAEAAYMTMIERNGDIVRLASYAPLLAKERHTQWRPDLIYFDNTNLLLSANYYVQQMFGQNQGDAYLPSTVSATNLAVSCVRDSRTGDTILKFVNVTGDPVEARVRFPDELKSANHGSRMVLTGEPNGQNSFAIPRSIVPVTSPIQLGNSIVLDLPPHSLTVIRAGNPKGNRLEPQTGAVPQPILEGFTADPSIRVFGDTYYLYPTSDKPNWNTTEFAVWTSKNLIDWKKEGVILDVTKDLKWADLQAWAPDCVERNGTYYFYFCARGKIGVATAKSPLGPFQDALDRPLIQKGGKVDIYPIDPYPFIDSDGQPYLYYGNGRCAQVFKLKPDMISFDGDPVDIPLKDFREGIVVFKRADKYYFMWSIDDARSPDYRVGWGIADKPLGPVRTPDKDFIVLRRHGAAVGTAHHSVVNVPGTDRWYVAYHRHAIPGGGGYQRETCLVRMEFDANGAIKPMDPLTAPFQLGDVGEPIAVAK